jgi:hypothetical protein
MTHPKLSKLNLLEQLIPPYLKAKRQEEKEQLTRLKEPAQKAIRRLGALVLYGEPKLDEPLALAWQRCLTLVDVKSPGANHYVDFAEALLFRRLMTDLPGENETEKFKYTLSKAPIWLLRFTSAKVTAYLIGIACPDLSAAPAWGRVGLKDARNWPLLPQGTLQAGDPIKESDFPVSEEDAFFLFDVLRKDESQWTRQEHRRFRELLP